MSAETIAQMQLQPNAHLVHFEIDEGAFERAETVPQMQLQCAVPGCPERGGRDRQTDRQKDRDRQTDRQTDRKTETDRKTDRQTEGVQAELCA